MYKVLKRFFDLQDDNYLYDPEDAKCNTYPRDGFKPSPERIAELSGSDNKIGCPLIAKVEKKAKKAATKKPEAAE